MPVTFLEATVKSVIGQWIQGETEVERRDCQDLKNTSKVLDLSARMS